MKTDALGNVWSGTERGFLSHSRFLASEKPFLVPFASFDGFHDQTLGWEVIFHESCTSGSL